MEFPPQRQLGWLLTALCLLFAHGVAGRILTQKETGTSPPGGFLEDEVPLTVLRTIPEKLLTGGRIAVTGRQTLTVVLSRPVIGLGRALDSELPEELKPFFLFPEVAGQYRWLTTYIAVFEPAEDWAPDLEVDFEWNNDLVTFDGVQLLVRPNSASRLTTPALELSAISITSNHTNYLTDNFWDAFVGTSYDALPEVPMDASIQISASSQINLAVLQNSLLIVDTLTNGNPPVSTIVKECTLPAVPCPDCSAEAATGGGEEQEEAAPVTVDIYGGYYQEQPEEEVVVEPDTPDEEPLLTGKTSNCIEVSFNYDQQGFLQGRRYSLVLPGETQYSNDAGPLTRDIAIDFAGLRDFRVPFVEEKGFNISNSRLQLWLPHGLAEGVNVTDFPMKIVRAKTGQDVDFSLEMVTKSVVRVVAEFNPGSTYKISVFESPTFKDGYGLNLKRSNLNFLAAPIEPFFGSMAVGNDIPLAIFEEGEKWGQKISVLSKGSALSDEAVCKDKKSSVSVWDVLKPQEALPLLSPSPRDEPVADLLGTAADRLVDERTDIAGDISEIDISKLLRTSGLVAGSYCRNEQYHPIVVCQTQLQVVVLMTSAIGEKGRTGLVWVTNMKSSNPVSGATVTLYEVKGDKIGSARSGKTDKQGVASVTIAPDVQDLHVIVTASGKSVYVPYVEVQNSVVSSISDSIIMDRPIVRPGEWLHVKGTSSTPLPSTTGLRSIGYVMQTDGSDFLPAAVKNVRVVVTPSMVTRSRDSDELEIAKYNKEFGSYTLSLRVPVSVISVHHTVHIEADVAGEGTYVGSPESFSVMDSRRAPAVLSIDAPTWASPNKKVKVNAEVTSFAGAAIQDAKIEFVWSIDDGARDEEDMQLRGVVRASTDRSGKATANIDLSEFTNPPSAGTVLSVTAHYTGSSGERVERTMTVRLELADIDIVLEKTTDTDIPNQGFGIRAAVFDLSGKRLTKGTVSYALKEIAPFRKNGRPTLKPTTAGDEISGKASSKCERSFKSAEFCTFTLPGMGEYVVEACVKVGKTKVCKRSYQGKTEDSWKEAPLESHLPFGIMAMSTGPYSVGDDATFLIDNPFEDVALLLAWGSRDAVKSKIETLKPGRTTLKFKIDATCSGNCALSISASIPRQKKGLATNLKLPVNAVFDPAMPHTEYYATVIETKRPKTTLPMKVSLPGIKIDDGMPLMEPGVNASVRVTFERKGPVEITAFAIDTAILDLLPYPLKDVSDDFITDLSDYFRYKSTAANMVAPGAIDVISEANNARKKLDPWFKMISKLQPSEETDDIDLTDDEYLEQYVQYLTVVPRSEEERLAGLMPQADNSEETTEDSSGVVLSGASISERPSYITPTLFESFTASGGIWLVNFEGPVDGGVFAIRAYASTGTGLFGSDEVYVKVKRKISVDHDFPAFARLGDEFEAGVTISTLDKARQPIVLTIQVPDNMKMSGQDEMNVAMGGDLEKEVRFRFQAVGVGEARIKVTADDGFGNAAKTTVGLTIYGPQAPVVHGSAFEVSGDLGEEPSTEMAIPDALEGSGSLVVTAGQGHLPGILLLADQIYSQDSFTCPISADFVLAAIAIPAIVDTYFPWSPDPNLLPKFYVDLINSMIPSYQDALNTIYKDSTSQSLGLETEVSCPAATTAKPTGISLEQNAKGIFIVNEVEKPLREHSREVIYKNTAAATTARKTWISVLEEGLLMEAVDARDAKSQISTTTVALAYLALGASWEPSKTAPSSVRGDLALSRLSKEFSSMSVVGQAYYILALLDDRKADQADVRKAVKAWSDKVVVSGNKAYLATAKNSVTAESNLANSLVFLALVRADADKDILKRMAYYVTAPVSDSYGFNEYPIFAKTVAMMALSEYDATVKNRRTSVRLEVRSGTIILFSASFTLGRHPVSAQSTLWEDLGKSPGPIQVFPQGSGEVNVAIALKYVPRAPLENPVYKGIYVDRIIQLDSAGALSEAVTHVALGTVVNVKVHFMTSEDLEHTTVQVFLPAGLEPVQLGGEGAEFCPIPFFDLFDEDTYPSCPEQVTLADQVQFVYESVRAGAHSVEFKAVAAIAGSYGVPPARAFVTETPSIMGMSDATRLDICASDDKKCSFETAERDFVAVECQSDCNNNGACDLGTGKCACFYGFSGETCQKIGAA